MRRFLILALAASSLPTGPATAGLGLTPPEMCTKSGYPNGDPFRKECIDRVYKERKANFWRETGPYLMLGAVAGIAASGGSAFAVMKQRREPGVYPASVDGASFLVKLTGGPEATVRSKNRYKNVKRSDQATWAKAAETVTGCSAARQVRDFDKLYLWLECPNSPTPGASPGAAMSPLTVGGHSLTPTSSSAALSSGTSGSIADEVAKLATLRDRGLLTQAEFEAAKAKLLQR
jgi:hypothetical protein